ncbi:MAG TPA: Xaa-Pro peptidase family protein [Actinomycetes bacterium]|nr:Xaa-Pro peptidase family protein [Actinomycetes bacterium]
MTPPSELYPRDRIRRAQDATAQAGLDALLLTPGADLRYLTGYDAVPLERLTCLVVPADGDPVLVVPLLERPAALASPVGSMDLEIAAWQETDDPVALVVDRLRTYGGGALPKRVGLANRMWAEQVLRFRDRLPDAELGLSSTVLRALRMRKTPVEVDALRRAGAAIDRVHERMGDFLRAGRSEAEIAKDIGQAILDEGHVRADFIIVASGPNSASPHHEVNERLVEVGDPVVVDIGGTTADGYCSDSTRTYAVGHAPQDFLDYFAVLLDAQARAVEAVRPGTSCDAVDATARELITAAGYGQWFVHRTGHGIGLETHEDPYIVAGNTEPLEPGMAFSVEPGIYIAGRDGARIEDIVVCTSDGVERLNTIARDLVVVDG